MNRRKLILIITTFTLVAAGIIATLYWYIIREPSLHLFISESELTLIQGEAATLSVEIVPWHVKREVSWVSSSPEVVEVDIDGNVTALRTGLAVIYAIEPGGQFVASAITVSPDSISLSGGVYTGELKDGRPHWQGDWVHPDGHMYSGEWVEGVMQGHGTMHWPEGQTYTGQWQSGRMHGHGVMLWDSGQQYEGEWQYDKIAGIGTMIWPDGDKYSGEWQEDLMHGEGRMDWGKGESYQGQWHQGKVTGTGTYTWPDGTEKTGNWEDGKLKGE